jgi:hypothetical protein
MLEPAGYAELLEQPKARVRSSRVRAARAANSELLALYRSVGRDTLQRQEQAGWWSRVIERLAADLRAEFPDQRGWSRSKSTTGARSPRLGLTRQLSHRLWDNCPGVTCGCCWTSWQPGRSGTHTARQQPSRAGPATCWPIRSETRLADRVGAAPSNFTASLPAPDSDLARHLVRDPYVFDPSR